AFEVHAIDYLLKPFEYGRVREAVQRARSQLQQRRSPTDQNRMLDLLLNLNHRFSSWNRIAVRDSSRVIFVMPEDVYWIEAEGNYVRLHLPPKSYLLRDTLSSVEARLSGKKFLRVNRSALVNLEHVKEWQPLFHGDSVLILLDGARLTVSRVYREKLDELIS